MITPGSLAPLSVLFLLGTSALVGVLLLAAFWLGVRRRSALARRAALGAGGVSLGYGVILFGVAVASREQVIPIGGEKYFCELDCHLAYSVTSLLPAGDGAVAGTRRWAVVVRTWFDSSTISSRRSREAPTWPAPRRALLRGSDEQGYATVAPPADVPAGLTSTPLETALRPGESYQSVLYFELPAGVTPARLDLTDGLGVSPLLVGHERSPLHPRVWLALPAATQPG